ncbi:RagB/SusD family nutrient uptake outer membrane protein [uncultured Croceitalea sp.]|uniref:RagB/SusD family nutrient uptake outer membrane protein n=1 Tax=uncultured Croceitalea sp. TaxID=1798908 RepID=UPI0033067687
MKKYSLSLIISCVLLLFSCSDATEIEQPGRLTEAAAFETIADLQSGLLGTYGFLDTTSEIQFNAVFTDEVSIGFDNGGQGLGDGTWAFVLNNVSTAPNVFWTGFYGSLNNVNILIQAINNYEVQDGEQVDYNNILGEAYAIRAAIHHLIMSYFSPDLTDNGALAGILLDFVPTPEQQLPRNTNAEFYASIESDLTLAASLITKDQGNTFINDDFVTALRARVAAYRGDYATAAPLAQSLLASYPIANRAEYEAMFLDTDETENIFKLERTIGDNFDGQGNTGSSAAGGWAGANFAFVNATADGSPYFEMGRAVFNQLDPLDIRFDVNVAPTSTIDPDYQTSANALQTDRIIIKKYEGSENRALMNDLKVFRSSEMLFIMAEARADSGDLTGAAALIDQLRDARFGSDQVAPTYGSQQAAFAGILAERQIELAFEGHRYKDIKRLGVRAGVGVQRDAVDCSINGACSLGPDDFRFTLPIPRSEIAGNPEIANQQNPGY